MKSKVRLIWILMVFLIMAGGFTRPAAGASETAVGEFDFEKETVLLNSGWEMPVIGTGTWTLSDEEAEYSTYNALRSGMRLIDTARYYQNEKGVGMGLARAVEDGIVKREDVFITSKIFGGDHDRAAEMIDEALADLGVEYIDLMLIHQPGSDDEGVYKAMEEVVESGKLHSIGISNYYTKERPGGKRSGPLKRDSKSAYRLFINKKRLFMRLKNSR